MRSSRWSLNRISADLADDGRLQPGPFIGEFVRRDSELEPRDDRGESPLAKLGRLPARPRRARHLGFLDLCAGTFDCPWRAGAPMPLVSTGQAAAVHDGKVYVFGGSPYA